MNTELKFSTSSTAARLDSQAGIIHDVSVITVGPAKGHGIMVDAETLKQVKTCAERYSGGLKVKMDHAGNAGDIVGVLRYFRIQGDQLRADLHLLKTSKHRDYLLEVAEKIPASFGLSIAFSGPSEERNGTKFARCSEIYSADVVAEPAANPNGLFATGGKFIPDATFEQLVAKHTLRLGSKPAAIRYCAKNHTAAHAAYLSRVERGEIITL